MAPTQLKLSALRRAVEAAPEYASLTPFFEALYLHLDGRERASGISVDITRLDQEQRCGHGFPLVSATDLVIDRQLLAGFLLDLIEVMDDQGTQGEVYLKRLTDALGSGELDPCALVPAILERRRSQLEQSAQALQVPSALLEFLIEIPLKTALELVAADIPADAFSDWQENICPVCGSRPGMAELVGEEGHRQLCCSTCSYAWSFKRLKCPSCGCEDADQLSYFTAGAGATRVDTCRACSRYIKTRDTRSGTSDAPLEVEDLLTIHLDLLASREGFERTR